VCGRGRFADLEGALTTVPRASTRPVAEHYQRTACRYSQVRDRGLAGLVRRREQAAVCDLLAAAPEELVLDVGCGDGAVAGLLVRRGALPVSVDIAFPMARLARQKGARAVVADMAALGLAPRFDWVACIGALEFAARPEAVLEGFARCLRPGGQLVLLFPRRNWLGLALWLFHKRNGVRIRLWPRRRLLSWLTAAGFERPESWRRCAAAWVCRARLKTAVSGPPR
jgi:SAM-dependent methyltransferase